MTSSGRWWWCGMLCGLCGVESRWEEGCRSATCRLPHSNMTAAERLSDMGHTVSTWATLCSVCLGHVKNLDMLMARAARVREKIELQAQMKARNVGKTTPPKPDSESRPCPSRSPRTDPQGGRARAASAKEGVEQPSGAGDPAAAEAGDRVGGTARERLCRPDEVTDWAEDGGAEGTSSVEDATAGRGAGDDGAGDEVAEVAGAEDSDVTDTAVEDDSTEVVNNEYHAIGDDVAAGGGAEDGGAVDSSACDADTGRDREAGTSGRRPTGTKKRRHRSEGGPTAVSRSRAGRRRVTGAGGDGGGTQPAAEGAGGPDWNSRWRRRKLIGLPLQDTAEDYQQLSRGWRRKWRSGEPDVEGEAATLTPKPEPRTLSDEDQSVSPSCRTLSRSPKVEPAESAGHAAKRPQRASAARASAAWLGRDEDHEDDARVAPGGNEMRPDRKLFRLGRKIVTKQQDGSAMPVVKMMRRDEYGRPKVAFLDHKAALRAARLGRVGKGIGGVPASKHSDSALDWDTRWRKKTLGRAWRPRVRPGGLGGLRVMVKPSMDLSEMDQVDDDGESPEVEEVGDDHESPEVEEAPLLPHEVAWMAGGDGPSGDVEPRPWFAAEGSVHALLDVRPGEAWVDTIARTEAAAVKVKTEPGSPREWAEGEAQLPVPPARIKTEPRE